MKRIISFSLAIVMLSLALSACGQDAGSQEPTETNNLTWQEQYDLGVRYLSEGNYKEAIIAFTAAIEIDPKQALAYVGRGDAYVLSGETEENLMAAAADYETAIELDETLVEGYQKLAQVYLVLDDSDSMKEILEQGYALTNAEVLLHTLDDITSKTQDEESSGFSDKGIVSFLGKTMGDVIEQYGNDYYASNFEGSTYLVYKDFAGFSFGTFIEYPDINAVIKVISLYSSDSLIGNLTGAMTFPEIVDAVGEEVKLERPDYYFDEIDNEYNYLIGFTYQGYSFNYLWLEDPEVNASTSVTVMSPADVLEQPQYEPDMVLITERFERIGRNYITDVLSIPADAGFEFGNIEYKGDVWWSMGCYTPTDNGLRIFAFFEFDPWNDIATITPGWGGDFDAEFAISKYDY